MAHTEQQHTFSDFLQNHFDIDGTFAALGMQGKDGKMFGTKYNLSLEQIGEVHTKKYVTTDKGIYRKVPKC